MKMFGRFTGMALFGVTLAYAGSPAIAQPQPSPCGLPAPSNRKDFVLETRGNAPGFKSGASYDHFTWFAGDFLNHGVVLGSAKTTAQLTQKDAGIASCVRSIGTFPGPHPDARATSGFNGDRMVFDPATNRTTATGFIEWDQFAPAPNVLHVGEINGAVTNQTSMYIGATGTQIRGTLPTPVPGIGIPIRVPLNAPDDGTTTSIRGSQTNTDFTELYVSSGENPDEDLVDELLEGLPLTPKFRATTIARVQSAGRVGNPAASERTGVVTINDQGITLRTGAPGDLARVDWILEDLSGTTPVTVSYFAEIENGVFRNSPNWAALWDITSNTSTDFAQSMSSFDSVLPSFLSDGGFDYTTSCLSSTDCQSFTFARRGIGVDVAQVPEPPTLGMMGLSLAALLMFRWRRT